VQVGDYLVSVGGIAVHDANWITPFRNEFNGRTGTPIEIVVRRGGQNTTLSGTLNTVDVVERSVELDPQAPAKAVRIRHSLFTGKK